MQRILNWLMALCAMLAFAGLPGAAAAADDFLAPEQAFKLRTELRDGGAVVLRWDIAPGYHLYRERLAFKGSSALVQPTLPAGIRTFDENFNKEMETYQRQLVVSLPVTGGASAAPFTLTVGYQGCADAGLCYPPQEALFKVDPAQPW